MATRAVVWHVCTSVPWIDEVQPKSRQLSSEWAGVEQRLETGRRKWGAHWTSRSYSAAWVVYWWPYWSPNWTVSYFIWIFSHLLIVCPGTQSGERIRYLTRRKLQRGGIESSAGSSPLRRIKWKPWPWKRRGVESATNCYSWVQRMVKLFFKKSLKND